MNKAELIADIADANQIPKALAERVLDHTLDTIKVQVQMGSDVKIVGFGTFQKMKRKARKGRNPQTGALIDIKPMWVPRFRPGAEFKTLVRGER